MTRDRLLLGIVTKKRSEVVHGIKRRFHMGNSLSDLLAITEPGAALFQNPNRGLYNMGDEGTRVRPSDEAFFVCDPASLFLQPLPASL